MTAVGTRTSNEKSSEVEGGFRESTGSYMLSIGSSVQLSPRTARCFCGFSLLIAWVVFLCAQFVSSPVWATIIADSAFESLSFMFPLFFLALGIIIASSLFHRIMNRFSFRTLVLCGLLSALALFAYMLIFSLSTLIPMRRATLACLLLVCAGGSEIFYVSFFQLFFESFKQGIYRYLFLAIAAGSFVGCVFSIFPWLPGGLFASVLLLISIVLYGFEILPERTNNLSARVSAKDSDSRKHIDSHATIPVIVMGFSEGFAYCFLLRIASSDYVSIACAAAFGLPAFVWLCCVSLNYIIKESSVAKIVLPTYIILFVLFFIPSDETSLFAAWGLISFSMFGVLLSLCALCEHAIRDDLLVSRFLNQMIFQTALSGVVGFLTSVSVATIFNIDNVVVLVCVVSVLVIMLTAVSRKNTWPGQEALFCYDSATCPMRSISPSKSVSLGEPVHLGGRFLQRCEAIATDFSLTDRQKEILVLLAKGRNAEYISKELTISPYTAKTHIYTVFQKLDIHSQQDLIDFVETWPIN